MSRDAGKGEGARLAFSTGEERRFTGLDPSKKFV